MSQTIKQFLDNRENEETPFPCYIGYDIKTDTYFAVVPLGYENKKLVVPFLDGSGNTLNGLVQ